ncbi:hypothetical protein G7046_g1029 [Stylonectria norvegica]|nr:hypothetical protein G7046_g1029 [Stylonectria norvegica]
MYGVSQRGGFQPRAQVAVPTEYRCKIGGEWKTLEHFSVAQQKLIQRQINNGKKVDASHSGMACKEHTSRAKIEFRCELCRLIKHIDEFSKTSRRNEVYECKRCIAWSETQEPGVTPAPLETGHISIEEQNNEVWTEAYADSGNFFDDDALPRAPVTDLESLGLGDLVDQAAGLDLSEFISGAPVPESSVSYRGTAQSVSGESVTSGATNSLPPHLAALHAGAPTMRAPSTTGSMAEVVQDKKKEKSSANYMAFPPHLRPAMESAQAKKQAAELESASQRSEASHSTSVTSSSQEPSQNGDFAPLKFQQDAISSVSTATTIREDRERAAKSRQIPFNAWDPTGNQHSNVKQPTVGSSRTSTLSGSEFNEKSGESWKENLDNDDEWTTVEPVKTRGRSKWPTKSEVRIPQSQLNKQPVLMHTSARHVDPDIDRQRKMNYCDDSDSDY